MTLLEVFESLPLPELPGSFTARRDPLLPFRVARTSSNGPALLFCFQHRDGDAVGRRLATLRYHPPSPVQVRADGASVEIEDVAVLECLSEAPELVDLFFRAASDVLLGDRRLSHEREFEAALDGVVRLFKALQNPGRRSLTGLWGELAIILWSTDVGRAIAAWHSSPNAVHDFEGIPHRLEIKTTAKGLREHPMALEQLRRLPGGATMVASLMVHEAEDGVSIPGLVSDIRARLDTTPEQSERFEQILAASLGQGWSRATDVRFALSRARSTLRLVRASEIPWVSEPLPSEVSDVRFTADLSAVPYLDVGDARAESAWLASILPPS